MGLAKCVDANIARIANTSRRIYADASRKGRFMFLAIQARTPKLNSITPSTRIKILAVGANRSSERKKLEDRNQSRADDEKINGQ